MRPKIRWTSNIPHPRETVMAAYEMRAQGVSMERIGRELGVGASTIAGWVTQPDRWAPHFDEIALERALRFDGPVIDNLSYFEFIEFCRRLNAAGKVMDAAHPHARAYTALADDVRRAIQKCRTYLAAAVAA